MLDKVSRNVVLQLNNNMPGFHILDLCLLKLDLGYFNFVIGERPQRRYFVNNCESAKPSCNVKLRWRGKFERWY